MLNLYLAVILLISSTTIEANVYWRQLRQSSQPKAQQIGERLKNRTFIGSSKSNGVYVSRILRGGGSAAYDVSISCPAQCSCQGLAVNCSSKSLKAVPANIPLNAIKVDLQGNQISRIRVDDFSDLKNLKVLHLQDNQIEIIEKGAFDSLPYLERLRLNSNKLSSLPNGVFANLKSLKRLDLSSNRLRAITKDMLSGLNNLNNLQIDNNMLRCIEKGSISSLNRLDILRLQNNRLECSCGIMWLSKWFAKKPNLAHDAKCSMRGQKAAQKDIISLNEKDFDCSDENNGEDKCVEELQCPYQCSCENGIVDCKEKSLTEIPKNLPASTVELHLKKNMITEIPKDAFTNLKKLRLLDLSNNKIQKIYTNSFRGLDSLNTLILFRNELEYISSPSVFDNLPSLQFLLLNANKLRCLKRDTFSRLTNLNLLSLFDNQLKTLPDGVFDSLASVQTIHLGRNPLVCDCNLRWLNEFLRAKPVERSGVVCSGPRRLARKVIGSIPSKQFKCNSTAERLLASYCAAPKTEESSTDESSSVEQALLSRATTTTSNNECPRACQCRGTVVDCRSRNLTRVPANIPDFATELNLQDNKIDKIEADGVFRRLKTLQRLDLRNNLIKTIENDAFLGADNLIDLFLNDNKLDSLRSEMFNGLDNLKILLLRTNQLASIENTTFENLKSLRILSLYNNRIRCIQKGTFASLKSLSTLNLMSNPFECTCALKWLKKALQSSNLVAGNPKCTQPAHLRDQAIMSVDESAFECGESSLEDECPGSEKKRKPTTTTTTTSSPIQIAKSSSTTCPRNCSCTQNGVVRCSHAGLTKVPLDIPITVQELYLDSNEISEIPSFIKSFVNLEKLDISSNRIRVIPSRIFDSLYKLDTLILSFNQIECVKIDSFSGLHKLRLLSLYANHISTLPEGSFKDLTLLSHIALGLNPLYCDCNLAWLSTWIKTDYVEPGIARCNGPSSLANKLVLTTPTFYFECRSENQAPENKCHACYKHKCAHNSTCVAVATKSNGDEDEYKCECPIGYYGARCDRQIDACFGQPCKNSGTCRVLSGGAGGRYVCECAPGWEGFACEINTNECRSAPCKNGATCVDKLAGFECNCAFGFTGAQCEQTVEWCTSAETNPCQNGGKCTKTDDSSSSYKCACMSGYEGKNCENNQDDCVDHKCQFGVCVDGIGNYTCRCKDGFSGQYCDIMVPIALPLQQVDSRHPNLEMSSSERKQSLPECSDNIDSCLNGGICNEGTCKCPYGYSGSRCELLTSVQFKYDDAYVEMQAPDFEQTVNITFTVITSAEFGVLLYYGSKSRANLAVELFKGRVRVSFDLGGPVPLSGPAPSSDNAVTSMYTYAKINDLKEHTIELVINGSTLQLKLVDKSEKRSLGGGQHIWSNRYLQVGIDEPIYLGGVPNSIKDRISATLGHVKNATSMAGGCLSSLYVNSRLRDLARELDYSHKISPGCSHKSACGGGDNTQQSSPCMNGGKCLDRFTLRSEFSCECSHDFTGSLCETPLRLPGSSGGLQYRALPLVADSSSAVNNVRSVKSSSCGEMISKNEIYTDPKTGCKSRKRVKLLSCRGECQQQQKYSSPNINGFEKFQLSDDKTNAKFSGYLIGTNKRESPLFQPQQCCQVSKRRPKKLRLFCDDGSSYVTEIEIVRKCSCVTLANNSRCLVQQ